MGHERLVEQMLQCVLAMKIPFTAIQPWEWIAVASYLGKSNLKYDSGTCPYSQGGLREDATNLRGICSAIHITEQWFGYILLCMQMMRSREWATFVFGSSMLKMVPARGGYHGMEGGGL